MKKSSETRSAKCNLNLLKYLTKFKKIKLFYFLKDDSKLKESETKVSLLSLDESENEEASNENEEDEDNEESSEAEFDKIKQEQ